MISEADPLVIQVSPLEGVCGNTSDNCTIIASFPEAMMREESREIPLGRVWILTPNHAVT